MQLKTNSRLQSGKYRIIRVLGQGGFGITYHAENILLGKKVAIKEFFPKDFCGRDNTSHLTLGTQNNAETVSKLKNRFLKEAENISKLNHPGIVHIHHIFEENNTAYYVMDYIDGENLNEIVKRSGPLSEGKAVKYIEKVGEALEYIHSRNMTHFDVKPANIVIRRKDDEPILIDFGLSKQYDVHGDATSTLMQGISQGYSPIELYNYGAVSTFSPQTDVYSLGATLLYLVSGKVPPQPSSIIENGLDLSYVGDSKLRDVIVSSMQVGRGKRPTISDILSEISSFRKLSKKDNTIPKGVESNSPIAISESEETILTFENSESSNNKVDCRNIQKTILSLEDKLEEKNSELTQHKEILSKKNEELRIFLKKSTDQQNEISELSSQIKRIRTSKNIAWTIGILGSLLLGIVCIVNNKSNSEDFDLISNELSQTKIQNKALSDSVKNYQSLLKQRDNTIKERDNIIKSIAKNTEVFISDIEVRNSGENYEGKIFSRNTTFINPRFKVINLSDNSKTIGVKFYAPYGLATGDYSRNGYSYTETIPAKYGADSPSWFEGSGWGNTDKGSWMAGKYRIEFWSDGKCVSTKHFTI